MSDQVPQTLGWNHMFSLTLLCPPPDRQSSGQHVRPSVVDRAWSAQPGLAFPASKHHCLGCCFRPRVAVCFPALPSQPLALRLHTTALRPPPLSTAAPRQHDVPQRPHCGGQVNSHGTLVDRGVHLEHKYLRSDL